MRKMPAQIIVAMLSLAVVSTSGIATDLTLHDAPTSVYFSPRGGAQDALVDEIGKARMNIYVQAYSFTSNPIIAALIEAHQRGVKVEILLDKSQRGDNPSSIGLVKKIGIPTFIDSRHGIAHNKIMIIDDKTLVTGSFNFTKAAEERNAENLLIIYSSELARLYYVEWEKHRGHSERQSHIQSITKAKDMAFDLRP